MQTSASALPWNSITFRDPAAWWSPSTFWVMTDRRIPIRSSSARPRWAAFGTACERMSIISESMVQTFPGSRRKAPMVAYSIGSYRSHNPCAPRKAGIPLSTETPAPVSATAFFLEARTPAASRMRSRASTARPSRSRLDEGAELEGEPHIPRHLELSGHERHLAVELARQHVQKIALRHRHGAVGRRRFSHSHGGLAVLHRDVERILP